MNYELGQRLVFQPFRYERRVTTDNLADAELPSIP